MHQHSEFLSPKITLLLRLILLLALVICFGQSCNILQNPQKAPQLTEGNYALSDSGKKVKAYVHYVADTLEIHKPSLDTTIQLPDNTAIGPPSSKSVMQAAFDLDLLSAAFKYRPKITGSSPRQLNANFNANIYAGYRKDIYDISYEENMLEFHERSINQFAFGGGIFVGFGQTFVAPFTTNNEVDLEYDGLVLQKGIAGILAFNEITIGAGVGTDNLLDQNSDVWIYENELWYAFMVGINLN